MNFTKLLHIVETKWLNLQSFCNKTQLITFNMHCIYAPIVFCMTLLFRRVYCKWFFSILLYCHEQLYKKFDGLCDWLTGLPYHQLAYRDGDGRSETYKIYTCCTWSANGMETMQDAKVWQNTVLMKFLCRVMDKNVVPRHVNLF